MRVYHIRAPGVYMHSLGCGLSRSSRCVCPRNYYTESAVCIEMGTGIIHLGDEEEPLAYLYKIMIVERTPLVLLYDSSVKLPNMLRLVE